MKLELERGQILDIKMAINSIIFDFQSEINSPETRDERKAAANKSIQNRWIPLLKNIEQQFKEQEDQQLNIFKRKSKSIGKRTSADIKAIQRDIQKAAEQYETTRQQLLKNLAPINSIL